MISLSLLILAVLVAFGGAQVRRVRLFDRAPRLGVLSWQALSLTAIASLTLAGLTLIVPTSSLGGDLASLLQACVYTLQAAYASPTQLPGVTIGAALAVGTTGWAGAWVAVELTGAARDRARARDALALVSRHDCALDATVVHTEVLAAYCLPGRRERVVLTTATVAALDSAELAAVIAHERAHLRQRHHLALAAARGLARAFPAVPLFAVAAVEVARLLELCADDAAASDTDGVSVAGALVALAGMRAPAAALAAAGSVGAVRVSRLLDPRETVWRHRPGGSFCSGSPSLWSRPVFLATYPAFAAAGADICTLPPL